MNNPLISKEVIVRKGTDSEYNAFIVSMEWMPNLNDGAAIHVCSVVDAKTLEIKNPLTSELTMVRSPFTSISEGKIPQK